MAELPEQGKFKIATIGPKKDIPKKDKSGNWTSYSLQFEEDPNWYDTFWLAEEPPVEGQELSGTKSEHEKFGLQFAVDRPAGRGKGNWNPAGANATVMGAAVDLVNGFLSIGENYALWEKSDEKVKENFTKYINTVDSVAKQLKEKVVAMGPMQQEQKTAEKTSNAGGDDGVGTPPNIPGWPEGEEEQDV